MKTCTKCHTETTDFRGRRNACRACERLYTRQRAEEHPDKVKAAQKKHYMKNHVCMLARRRAYYYAHIEEQRESAREYQEKHPEARQRYEARNPTRQRDYRKANPEAYRAQKKRRRSLQRGAPVSDLTAQQWRDIQAVQGHRCIYCHKRAKGHLTQDHITPLFAGGSHTLHNVVGACKSCNSKKHKNLAPILIQPLLL